MITGERLAKVRQAVDAHRALSSDLDPWGTTTASAVSRASGWKKRMASQAATPPQISAAKKGATEAGLMPVNVLDSVRAKVTAGLAKLVDDVKK
jgi:hypothetical protein